MLGSFFVTLRRFREVFLDPIAGFVTPAEFELRFSIFSCLFPAAEKSK